MHNHRGNRPYGRAKSGIVARPIGAIPLAESRLVACAAAVALGLAMSACGSSSSSSSGAFPGVPRIVDVQAQAVQLGETQQQLFQQLGSSNDVTGQNDPSDATHPLDCVDYPVKGTERQQTIDGIVEQVADAWQFCFKHSTGRLVSKARLGPTQGQ